MAHNNNRQFSTYDRDNDISGGNCGFHHQGGWWHGACTNANLNAPHTQPSTHGVSLVARLTWHDGTGFQDLSAVEMKIRVKQCLPVSETC